MVENRKRNRKWCDFYYEKERKEAEMEIKKEIEGINIKLEGRCYPIKTSKKQNNCPSLVKQIYEKIMKNKIMLF